MPSSNQQVLKYVPKVFESEMPKEAQVFLSESSSKDFSLDELVKVRTKLAEQEEANLEDQIEKRALEKLKEIQEPAYQQAFNLGLEEGKKQAFEKATRYIEENLEKLTTLLNSMAKLKEELANQNESHLVQLVFHIASRLAQTTLENDPELIVNIVKSAVGLSQGEERVVLQVAPSHFEFLESLKKSTSRELEFMKNIKIEPVDGLAVGGCIVETNYGEIDARLDVRIAELWKQVADHLHKVKPKMSVA